MIYFNRFRRKFFFLLFVLLLTGLLASVVMALWNLILPEVLGVKFITYWQALGLLLLSRILFGGFRFGAWGNPYKSNYRKRKWMKMSDEERARLRAEWKKRCRK